MLNRIIAITLLFALTASGFSRFFVYAGFELNQKYIATVLCENKDKPQMHCNGKCYLAKKLKQAEEKEKRQEENNLKKSVQDSVFTIAKLSLGPLMTLLGKGGYADLHFDLPKTCAEILHPPPAVIYLS